MAPRIFVLVILSLFFPGCDKPKAEVLFCTPAPLGTRLPEEAIQVLPPGVAFGDVRVGPHSVGPQHVAFVARNESWDWLNHYFYGGTLHLWDLTAGESMVLNEDSPFSEGTTAHGPSVNHEWILSRMTQYDGSDYESADFIHGLAEDDWSPVATDHLEVKPFTSTAERDLGQDRVWYLFETRPPKEFENVVAPWCGLEVFVPLTGESYSIISWESSCDSITMSLGDEFGAVLARDELQIYSPNDVRVPVDTAFLGEYQPTTIRMEGAYLLVEGMRLHELDTGDGTRLYLDTEIFAYHPATKVWSNLSADPWFVQREPRYKPPLLAYVNRAPLCLFQRNHDDFPYPLPIAGELNSSITPETNPYATAEQPTVGQITLKHVPSGKSIVIPPLSDSDDFELLAPVGLLTSPWRLIVAWYGTAFTQNDVPGTLVIIDLEAAGLVNSLGEILP